VTFRLTLDWKSTSHVGQSAMVEHSSKLKQRIQLNHTANLSTNPRYIIASPGRWLRVSTVPTIWTGRMASVWENCGILSPAPWKNYRKPPSHDSKSGFSTVQRRSVHIALMRGTIHICFHRTLAILSLDVLASCHCLHSSPHACNSLPHEPVPCLLTTPLHFFPVFFLDKHSSLPTFFRIFLC
jgi:hypothetical protein